MVMMTNTWCRYTALNDVQTWNLIDDRWTIEKCYLPMICAQYVHDKKMNEHGCKWLSTYLPIYLPAYLSTRVKSTLLNETNQGFRSYISCGMLGAVTETSCPVTLQESLLQGLSALYFYVTLWQSMAMNI